MDEIVVKLNDLSAAKRKLEALALTQQARLDALINDKTVAGNRYKPDYCRKRHRRSPRRRGKSRSLGKWRKREGCRLARHFRKGAYHVG